MNTAKAQVTAMLAGLHENCSLQDIRYHLDVLERIKRSQDRVADEGIVSDDAAMKRLDRWLTD
jgi:hypothetical protein